MLVCQLAFLVSTSPIHTCMRGRRETHTGGRAWLHMSSSPSIENLGGGACVHVRASKCMSVKVAAGQRFSDRFGCHFSGIFDDMRASKMYVIISRAWYSSMPVTICGVPPQILWAAPPAAAKSAPARGPGRATPDQGCLSRAISMASCDLWPWALWQSATTLRSSRKPRRY